VKSQNVHQVLQKSEFLSFRTGFQNDIGAGFVLVSVKIRVNPWLKEFSHSLAFVGNPEAEGSRFPPLPSQGQAQTCARVDLGGQRAGMAVLKCSPTPSATVS
jgi:hypothetical protein